MSAIDDIAAERARQIEALGWTPEHDDHHDKDDDCELGEDVEEGTPAERLAKWNELNREADNDH